MRCLIIQVNLGVLKKNETINEELLECLREYQKHIPDDSHALLVGECKEVYLFGECLLWKSGVLPILCHTSLGWQENEFLVCLQFDWKEIM